MVDRIRHFQWYSHLIDVLIFVFELYIVIAYTPGWQYTVSVPDRFYIYATCMVEGHFTNHQQGYDGESMGMLAEAWKRWLFVPFRLRSYGHQHCICASMNVYRTAHLQTPVKFLLQERRTCCVICNVLKKVQEHTVTCTVSGILEGCTQTHCYLHCFWHPLGCTQTNINVTQDVI